MKKYEKLDQFFEKIKNLSFWQRIFGWRPVRTLSYEAFEEYKAVTGLAESGEEKLAGLLNQINLLEKDKEHLSEDNVKLQNSLGVINTNLASVERALTAKKEALASREEINKQTEQKVVELQTELKGVREKLTSCETVITNHENNSAAREEAVRQLQNKTFEQQTELKTSKDSIGTLQGQLAAANQEIAIFKKTETDRAEKYETDKATLKTISDQIQKERAVEKQKIQDEEIERLVEMKETWARHESIVQETIKMICQKHTIEYVNPVPFKGKPDNTIQIGEEFIIFDAKSPSSDDLKNFPTYIKSQAELVKKYVKEQNVRKDIFLVIPSNTVNVVEKFCFNMADYNVYVVTVDVLEPLILALRKVEDYEFLEQLTPEDRENICRIIGKFVHITKRKMQIDFFFTKEFLDVLKKCEANLPSDILEEAAEYEKAEKINPPRETRSKLIPLKELEEAKENVQSGLKRLSLDEQQLDMAPSIEGEN